MSIEREEKGTVSAECLSVHRVTLSDLPGSCEAQPRWSLQQPGPSTGMTACLFPVPFSSLPPNVKKRDEREKQIYSVEPRPHDFSTSSTLYQEKAVHKGKESVIMLMAAETSEIKGKLEFWSSGSSFIKQGVVLSHPSEHWQCLFSETVHGPSSLPAAQPSSPAAVTFRML